MIQVRINEDVVILCCQTDSYEYEASSRLQLSVEHEPLVSEDRAYWAIPSDFPGQTSRREQPILLKGLAGSRGGRKSWRHLW